jgi:hypothetical protein
VVGNGRPSPILHRPLFIDLCNNHPPSTHPDVLHRDSLRAVSDPAALRRGVERLSPLLKNEEGRSSSLLLLALFFP